MHDDPPFPYPVLESLREAPGDIAFEHGDRLVTRGELLDLIERLAAALRDKGLGPGRGVALSTGVSPEAFAAHMAAHLLGCRVLCVRPGLTPRLLAHVLGMEVDAVIADASTATPDLFAAAGPAAVVSLGPVEGAADLLPCTGRVTECMGRMDDVALLTFTSGSTGVPKGCAFTYRGLGAHWSWNPRNWTPMAADVAASFERFAVFGTLAASVILDYVVLCVLGGGTAVIPVDDGRPLYPYAIERHRLTGTVMAAPRLCQMLDVLREEKVDTSSLRVVMVGGSPITPHRLSEAVERLGPVVYHGYGMTEGSLISMLTPADLARFPNATASAGLAHPAVEISVRDEDGRELPTGHTGELYVRSPYLMTSYWNQPEETREVLRDGWLRTRDLGHLDTDGLLYLSGRIRDVILVHASVVYAGPIERLLATHPTVAEAYVTAAPDDRTGEAVHAFIVPVPGQTPDPTALTALVRAELGADSVPQTITTVTDVPVAPSGKPDKRALLAQYGPAPLGRP